MTYATVREALADLIRLVPDFPAEGVIFEDLTPVLANKDGLRMVIDALAAAAERYDADLIGGLDARGFLLGSAVAYKLGLGIVAIRKKGKLPPPGNMRWNMAWRHWRYLQKASHLLVRR